MDYKVNKNIEITEHSLTEDDDFIQLPSEYLLGYSNQTKEKYIYKENEERSSELKKIPSNKKYKNVYCANCGEKGHVVKDCSGPITSFGILAFKIVNDPLDEIGDKNLKLEAIIDSCKPSILSQYNKRKKIKFLMIQRKDTMGYIDFVRGKYPENDKEKYRHIEILLKEMTEEEKINLITKSFDEIWKDLWVNHDSKCFKNEYEIAKMKFELLNIKQLVNIPSLYYFQEFGFPKGRRNMKETNIACAEREFYEETGYDKNSYVFIKNYPTIHEEFTGTNGVQYRHIYYLVKMKDDITAPRIDQSNKIQAEEVQNIGWLTFNECMGLIRPYDIAKKEMIQKVYIDLVNMNDNYSCSNFYYNTKKQNFISSYKNNFY